MPFLTADVTDERDALATFAHQQIHQLATTLHGVDRKQLAATPTASAFSLGTLARHGIRVAQDVLVGIRSAPDRPELPSEVSAAGSDSWSAEDGAEDSWDAEEDSEDSWGDVDALRPDDDADTLIAELEQVAAEIAQAIRAAHPDTEVPVPDVPWFATATRWTVRWCALHLIEEFARHAGHADILRETLDGTGAYELNALADGEPWPPAGW